MPVDALTPTTPTEKTKPPRRSWRHLPASPPVADPLPFPDADQLVAGYDATQAGDGQGGDDTLVQPIVATPPPRHRRRWLVAAGAVVAVSLAAGTFLAVRDESQPTAASTTGPTLPGGNGSVQEVVKQVSAAVVQLEPGEGIGSGVVFDTSGLILTAHHVVAGTEELTVKLADGTELPGRVVGRLPERDLAIVAVESDEDLPAAALAGENTVEVGEPVVAIGSPFGISQTVTAGIVSGLDREIDSPVGKLTGLIQTDAPINPGNSGGPLIDADAKIIGINSAIASTSGASAGVGFAVPVEAAKELIDQVRADGGAKAPSVADDSGSAAGGPLDGLLPPGLDGLIPDGLIPDGLDDLLGGNGDPMELLQRLLEGLLSGGLDGLDPFAPDEGGSSGQVQPQESLGLVEIPNLPDGWQQGRNSVRTSATPNGVAGTQDLTLEGPDGKVAVVAERGPDAAEAYAGLKGTATDLAGNEAKAIDGGGIAWMADDDLLVVLKADDEVSPRDVNDIAESIEVVQ